jgi:hypothetical protein
MNVLFINILIIIIAYILIVIWLSLFILICLFLVEKRFGFTIIDSYDHNTNNTLKLFLGIVCCTSLLPYSILYFIIMMLCNVIRKKFPDYI